MTPPVAQRAVFPNSQPFFAETEHQKGQAHFEAVREFLHANMIAHDDVVTSRKNSVAVAVTNDKGDKVFVRCDFKGAANGTWGGQAEYAVGVYKAADCSCPVSSGKDGQRLLMTTNRGVPGFENGFSAYMSQFTGRPLPAFSLGSKPR